MSKPWGGSIGSWAAEAERAEAEEHEQALIAGNSDPQNYPSLKEAASAKSKKSKKMSLTEFNSLGSYGSARSGRLTPEEMLQLPTGPKQRAPEELDGRGRLGGGFGDYDGGRRPYRGFEEERRGPPPRRGGGDFEVQPSRADEVDNWAAEKRVAAAPVGDTGRGSRYGSLGGGSRADEVDNWNFSKRQMHPAPPPARSSTFGSGFRDSGFDSDRWRRGDVRESDMGRPRLVLDPPKKEVGGGEVLPVVVQKTNKSNPFGAARPREEVLAEKGLDWKKLDLEIESKKSTSSRPTSSQGSRPVSSQSNRSDNVGLGQLEGVKPRQKVNPFGDAKPREVLLEEKGKDWRKMDLELEHRGVDRPETDEEKALKEDIDNLKKKLEKETTNDDASKGVEGDQTGLRDELLIKEHALESLTRELDYKVRFGQKAIERPGSGAGRFTERPPSQSGSVEDVRGVEFMERPRSRGRDVWARPTEDRRGGFHGGWDRGFLSNRDLVRSRSRERW